MLRRCRAVVHAPPKIIADDCDDPRAHSIDREGRHVVVRPVDATLSYDERATIPSGQINGKTVLGEVEIRDAVEGRAERRAHYDMRLFPAFDAIRNGAFIVEDYRI